MSEAPATRTSLGAVVLTGGTAVRLDGFDKAGIEIAGRTLLEYALDALLDVDDLVVVGPEVLADRPVTFRREDPVGGGPAAAMVAGLSGFLRLPDLVIALAVDMPRVTPHTVRRLVAAASGHDGALLLDEDGRRQYLCAAYSGPMLRAAGACDVYEMPMRALVSGFDLAEVPALPGEADDVDTWEDLRALRELFEGDAPRA